MEFIKNMFAGSLIGLILSLVCFSTNTSHDHNTTWLILAGAVGGIIRYFIDIYKEKKQFKT